MANLRRSSRWWVLAGAVSASVLLVAGGWWIALLFVSPQQVEAAAAPPSQAPLVASVERGDLVQSQTWPASVAFADQQSVPIAPPADAERSVVTKAPMLAGSQVSVGSVVLEVNGGPVFIFTSAFPFYRDLSVGDHGPDVRALQDGLVSLGLLGQADGTFGPRTADAVTALYARAGYTAPTESAATPPIGTDTTLKQQAEAVTNAPVPSVYVPMAALSSSSSLPSTVRSNPEVGELISESTALALDSATAEVRVTLASAEDLPAGSTVTLAVEGREPTAGTVLRVDVLAPADAAEGEDNPGASASEIFAIVQPGDGSAIAAELVGRPATVVVEREPLAKDSLLVPLSALSGQKDGSGTLLVEGSDGAFTRVRVEVIAVDEGMAAIASNDGAIREGQQVLLG